MEWTKFVKFKFLLFMIITNWITAICTNTITQFQKLLDGRFTSDLGTTNVYKVEKCIYLCTKTPSCLSVSYERLSQQCYLGSEIPKLEQVTFEPDWVVYYKIGLSGTPSGSSDNFVLVNSVMTWTEANNYCHSTYSGHLAHIKSEAIMNQLISLLDEHPQVKSAWAGASDSAEEGTWVWTDNTPVYDGYIRWQPRQPDNNVGNEDCLVLYSAALSHSWNDIDCLLLLVSICQY